MIKSAPYSFFITVACIFAILWFFFERRYRRRLEALESKRSNGDSSASVTGSGNSSISGSGNATVNNYLGSPPQAPPKTEEKRPANIICTGVSSARIVEDGIGQLVDTEGYPHNSVMAIIANDAVKGSGEATGVIAQVVFRDGNREVARGYGAWLNAYSRYASFPPGKVHTLVLARSSSVGVEAIFNPRDAAPIFTSSARYRRWLMQPHPSLQYRLLGDKPLQVEVSLVDGRGTLLRTLLISCQIDNSGQLQLALPPDACIPDAQIGEA